MMSNTLRIGWACVLFLAAESCAHAQTTKPHSVVPPPPPAPAPAAALGAPPKPTAPANLTLAGGSNRQIGLTWGASTEDGGGAIYYSVYETTDVTKCAYTSIAIDSSSTTSYTVTNLKPGTTHMYCVVATDAGNNDSDSSNILTVNTATATASCLPIPLRPQCLDFGPTNQQANAQISSNINAFYQTSGSYSFFNQIKSIYNGASASATVSADLATLNFPSGIQLTVTTNAQAGSAGTTTPSSGAVPTLTGSGAGQAAQNIIYGGTFVVSEVYPLVASGASKWGTAGGGGLIVDAIAKEGADIQNFKSGTNVNVISAPFHGSGQIEGYLQSNSINLLPNSQQFVGSVFIGGSYGYAFMSHGYARDYGFGTQVNNGIGQVSLGILLNGVAKITVSRAFGPSQTYIDSTTMAQTTVNNFKAWSFGIAYQSAAPAK